MKKIVGELWMTAYAVSPETPQYITMKDEWILATTNRGPQGDFIAVIQQSGFFCFTFRLSTGQAERFLDTVKLRTMSSKFRQGAQTP